MRVEYNQGINDTSFGKNLYVHYKKNIIGQTDILYAQILDFVRPQLEAMTKNADRYSDCDMFLSVNRKGDFKILVGDKLDSLIKRWFPNPDNTVTVKFSTEDIHPHYIPDTIIEHAQKAKEQFLAIGNYFTKS